MLIIPVFNAGNYLGQGKEYVEILYDSVIRNLPDGYTGKFVCFTDDPEPYHSGIEKRPLHGGLNGWWNVPYVFKDGHFEDGDRILLMGLDTIITGPLDEIVKYDGQFGMLRDIYWPDRLMNGVTMFPANTTNDIWQTFEDMGFPENLPRGEMETIEIWLKKHNITPDVLTDLFPGAILSYKEQARLHVPIGARIVYFHGLPRPHEVKGNYVEHIWKVGGGSIHDWHVQGNVDSDTLEKNVRHSLDLPCELLANQYMTPKDNRLLICGGGPSLEDHLMEISLLQKGGATVWALNNSFRYLCSKGIEPDAHVMLDARPENAEFIPFKTDALLLYSAQCHSDVFECGMKSGKVINWCPAIAPILDILREKKLKAGIVSIGSTVGLKALGLAHLFGFKNIDLYGYDSSYRNDKNHAYPQTLNDGEKIIDMRVSVDGHEKVFRCAPWMATQAEEFRQAIPNFLQEGVEITIHGDGLLPYIVTTMV